MTSEDNGAETAQTEIEDNLALSMALALYFHKEDEALGLRTISDRTFTLFQYGMEHQRVLMRLVLEAAFLQNIIKKNRAVLQGIIEAALREKVEPNIKVVRDQIMKEAESTRALDRIKEIQGLIETGQWRDLNAR